jgi:hypothetical protein
MRGVDAVLEFPVAAAVCDAVEPQHVERDRGTHLSKDRPIQDDESIDQAFAVVAISIGLLQVRTVFDVADGLEPLTGRKIHFDIFALNRLAFCGESLQFGELFETRFGVGVRVAVHL